jgi:RND family efflux transporter MFP subunit
MTPCRPLAVILTIALLSRCRAEPPSEPQAIPVRMETAARTDFAPGLTLLGVIRAAQSVPLSAQQRGVITYPSRFASGLRTGERVVRGETIAIIRNDQVLSSQAQARLQMDAAAADFERKRRSHDAGIVSAAEFSSAQLNAALAREVYANASREVSTLRLISPADGTLVVTKPYAPGTTVEPSNVLAEVVSGGAVVVESNVAAADRTLLRPSLPVHFTAHGSPPWSGSGHIAEVAAVVDATGAARIVSSIDRSADVPPPGTGVELQVALDHRRDVLTVPEDALVAGGDGPALFVLASAEGRSGFRVKRVRVESGGRANGRVEITSGLRDGDRVVVSGADGLADDALVIEAKE